MALPLLNVGVWIQGGRFISLYEDGVCRWLAGRSTPPPSRGGFSTFLPHSEPGGVCGTAEVCCQRGGFKIAKMWLYSLHDEMSRGLLRVKRLAIVFVNTQGSFANERD